MSSSCVAAAALGAFPDIANAQDGNKWHGHAETVFRPGTYETRGSLELFLPLGQDENSLFFLDMRMNPTNIADFYGNWGAGIREVVTPDLMIGGYAFFDAMRKDGNNFYAVTVGAEALMADFDVRMNLHIPLSETQEQGGTASSSSGLSIVSNRLVEQTTNFVIDDVPMLGVDGEVGIKVPVSLTGGDDLRLFAGGYHYWDDDVSSITGGRGTVEYRLTDVFGIDGAQLSLGGTVSYDNLNDTQAAGEIRLRLPLQVIAGRKNRPQAPRLTALEQRGTDRIRRDLDVRTREKTRGTVSAARFAVNPGTGLAYGNFFFADGANSLGSGNPEDPTTLADAVTRSAADGYVVLDGTNGTIVSPGVTLLSGQTVIGGSQSVPVRLSTGALTTFGLGGSDGAVSGTAGQPVFTLGDGVTLRDFAITGGAIGLLGNGIAGATLGNLAISGQTGDGIQLLDTTGTVSITGGTISGVGGAGVSASNVAALAITGATISAAGSAIDVDTGAGDTSLSIDNITASSTGANVMDLNGATGAGLLTINSLSGNTVLGGNGETGGIIVETATFDDGSGGDAAGGNTLIGTTSARVGGAGLSLNNVNGGIAFGDIDVANDGGTGVLIKDDVSFNFTATSGTINTVGGAALDIDPVTVDVTLDSVTSTNAAGVGINLDRIAGAFQVLGQTTVTNAGDDAISLSNNTAAITFDDVAISTPGDVGIDIEGANTGAIAFGDVTIDTPGSAGIDIGGTHTGGITFGNVDITGLGAGDTGVDLRTTEAMVTFATLDITGTNGAGSTGIDLTGSTNTQNVRTTGSGTISGVATGVNLTNGNITGVFQYGDGSNIDANGAASTISALTPIVVTGLNSANGTYNFEDANLVGSIVALQSSLTVYFVDAATGGAGTITDPGTIKGAEASGADVIVLLDSQIGAGADIIDVNTIGQQPGGIVDGSLNLDSGQRLFSFAAGDTLTVGGGAQANVLLYNVSTGVFINPFTGSGAPILTTSGVDDTVTLAPGNVISGVTIENSGTGAAISGNGFGTLTISDTTIRNTGGDGLSLTDMTGLVRVIDTTISSVAGDAVDINGGTGIIDIGASIINTSGHSVSVQNRTAGTVNFTGSIADTGEGILISGNSGGSTGFSGAVSLNTESNDALTLSGNAGHIIDFTGGLDIDTTSGTGIAAIGGGTLAVIGAGNTVDTATGQIVGLDGFSVGAAGIAFASLTSTGIITDDAILLSDVDGAGNTFSGGAVTVAGTSGAGSSGIEISGGSEATFTFASATIDNTGSHGIELNGANGAVSFTTVEIDGAGGNGLRVENNANTVTVSGGSIGMATTNNGAVAVDGGAGDVSIVAMTADSNGPGLSVSNRTGGTVTFSGDHTQSVSGTGVNLANNTGGNVMFSGLLSLVGAGTGVDAANNTGASFTFSGGLDIESGTNTGFSAAGGGTFNVLASVNNETITTTGASSLLLDGVALDLNFDTITSVGGVDGIRLNDTTGSVAVTGSTSLSNVSGAAVHVSGTSNAAITLADLDIALNAANTVGLDLNGATLTSAIAAGDFDLTSSSATGTIGVDLRGTLGGQSVVLGTQTAPLDTGPSSSIAGVETGVFLDATSDAGFVFGDGENGIDAASTINATVGIDASAAPVNGTYNFQDVSFADSPGLGFGVGTIYFVDSDGATGGGSGSGFDASNPMTLSAAESAANAGDIIILIDNGSAITAANSNLNDTFDLKDSQQILGFGDGAGGSQDITVNLTVPGTILLSAAAAVIADPTVGGAATLTTSAGNDVITLGDMGNRISGLILDGFDGVGLNAARGINDNGGGATNTTIERSTIQNFATVGVEITPSTNTTINNVDFIGNASDVLVNAEGTTITNVSSLNATGTAFRILNATGTTTLSNVSVTDAGGSAFDFDNAGGTVAGTNIDINGTGAAAIDIDGGTAAFSFDAASSILQNNAFSALTVDGMTAGGLAFGGLITASTSTAAGIALTGNGGATFSFAGGLDIDTSSGRGFSATGGGTISIANAGVESIATTTGTALELDGVIIGAGGIAFDSVTTTGSTTDAVNITGTSGGTVTLTAVSLVGTGAANGIEINGATNDVVVSGGTVSGRGVLISGGTGDVTIGADVSAADGIGFAVSSSSTGTVTMNGTVTSATGAVEIAGNTGGTVTFNDTITGTGAPTSGALNISGNFGGTYNFAGLVDIDVTGAGIGVNATTNSGATVNFTGGLDINAEAGTGFSAMGGGTISIANAGVESIATTTGTALELDGVIIGAGGIAFDSVTTTGSTTDAVNITGTSGGTVTLTAVSLVGTGAANGIEINGAANDVVVSGGTVGGRGVLISGGTGDVTIGADVSAAAGIGFAVSSRSIGTVTMNGTVTSATGAVEIAGNTGGTVTFNDTITGTGAPTSGALNISGNFGGTYNFAGLVDIDVTGAGIGVNATTNSGATVNFTGGLDINAEAGTGFSAMGGGIFSVAATAGTEAIDTTTGTALNLNGVTIAAGGMTFDNVGTTGAISDAVNLTSTSGGTATLTAVSLVAAGAANGIEINGATNDVVVSGGTVAGRGVLISGGTGDITIGANVTAAAGYAIAVGNRTTGTVTMNGTVNGSTGAVQIANHQGGTVTFTGVVTGTGAPGSGMLQFSSNPGGSIAFNDLVDLTVGGAVSAVSFTGTNAATVSFANLDITLNDIGATGFDLGGAVIDANITATDFDLDNLAATGTTVGIDLTGATGTGTVRLGDTDVNGESATIAGVNQGVLFSSATDLTFIFGDSEAATDVGSSISVVTPIGDDGTGLPAAGSYNFLDVTLTGDVSALAGPEFFVVDPAGSGVGAGTFASPGSIANAELSGAAVIVLIDTNENAVSDLIDASVQDGGGNSSLDLLDGQVLISLALGESIDVGPLGAVGSGAPAAFQLTGVGSSTIITAPGSGIDTIAPLLTSSGANNTVTLAGSASIANVLIGNSGTGDGIHASFAAAEALIINDSTIGGGTGGDAIDLATTADNSSFDFSNLTLTGNLRLDGSVGGVLTVSGAGTNTINSAAGQALSLDTVAIAAAGVSFSQVTSAGSASTGVTFDDVTGGNTVAITTLNVSGSTGQGVLLSGANAGTFTFGGASTVTTATGNAFEVQGGNAIITYSGSITNTSGRAVRIAGTTGGQVNLNGGSAVTDSGTGIELTGNAGTFSLATGDLNGSSGILIANGNSGSTSISNTTIDVSGDGLFVDGTGSTVSGLINFNNVDVTDPGGRLFRADGLSGATITFNADSTLQTSTGTGISIANATGTASTVNFNGAVTLNTGANDAVTLDTNTNGTTNFTGGLDIDTTTGVGFNATNGGTLSITGATNTIDATGSVGLNVQNTSIAASGLTFLSVSARDAAYGIRFENTGTAGGLTITGDGANAGSGGTIQDTTGNTMINGILINNARDISLSYMNLTNANRVDGGGAAVCDGTVFTGCNGAIELQSVTNVAIDNLVLNGALEHGIFGQNVTNFDLSNSTISNAGDAQFEHGVFFAELLGTAAGGTTNSFENVTVQGSATNNVFIRNTTATAAGAAGNPDLITVSNSTFQNTGASFGSTGFIINSRSTANMRLEVSNSIFQGNRGAGLAANGDGGDVQLTVTGSTFQPTVNDQITGISMGLTQDSTGTFDISNNPLINVEVGASGSPVGIAVAAFDTASFSGTIAHNTSIGSTLTNVLGIRIIAEGTAPVGVVDINNNIINSNVGGDLFNFGIQLAARDGGSLDATVRNNTITMSNGTFPAAIGVSSGNSDGDASNVCLNLFSNTTSSVAAEYFLEQFGGTTFALQGFAGVGTSVASVQSFVVNTDTNPGGVTADVAAGGVVPISFSSATCVTP